MANIEGREVHGDLFGVRFVRRGPDDPHCCVQLLTEDDERWIDLGMPFSSYWVDDLIRTLKDARAVLDTAKDDIEGCGKLIFLKGRAGK